MNTTLLTPGKVTPELDPAFRSAALALRRIGAQPENHKLQLAVEQPDGTVFRRAFPLLDGKFSSAAATNQRMLMYLVRSALWIYGGNKVHLYGTEPEVTNWLEHYHYELEQTGRFDDEVMAGRVYGGEFQVRAHHSMYRVPEGRQNNLQVRLGSKGCFIGFDLGGSNRRGVAIEDGKVVHQEDIPWDPYPQADPAYHYQGILATLQAAAAKLPRVDGIGGSAAGIYLNNQPRIASLFRGVKGPLFQEQVVPIFDRLKAEMGGVPFVVVNDGAVAALSASAQFAGKSVLSIALGTSTGGGFVTADGSITAQLDELAFVPVAINPEALNDEWSGFPGCASRLLSQQAIPVLAAAAGLTLEGKTVPDQLKSLQAIMKGDSADRLKAEQIYRTIGVHLGYAVAWFHLFYDNEVVFLTGRVVKGRGGDLIVAEALRVLEADFPELSGRVQIVRADDEEADFGQTITAAYLAT